MDVCVNPTSIQHFLKLVASVKTTHHCKRAVIGEEMMRGHRSDTCILLVLVQGANRMFTLYACDTYNRCQCVHGNERWTQFSLYAQTKISLISALSL